MGRMSASVSRVQSFKTINMQFECVAQATTTLPYILAKSITYRWIFKVFLVFIDISGQPKVTNFCSVSMSKKNVSRSQVSMNNLQSIVTQLKQSHIRTRSILHIINKLRKLDGYHKPMQRVLFVYVFVLVYAKNGRSIVTGIFSPRTMSDWKPTRSVARHLFRSFYFQFTVLNG